jgi:enoyl-CoA hydratase
MEILLTAGNFNARTLCEWGFLNRVVPVGGLMEAAVEMAERIAGNGPLAIQGIIRCFRESREMGYADAFRKEIEIGMPIFSSADAREGICAQKEKRKPEFPGTYN